MSRADALARLIAERAAQHGQIIQNARDPFDFAEWLRGVRDGMSVEPEPRQGPLL